MSTPLSRASASGTSSPTSVPAATSRSGRARHGTHSARWHSPRAVLIQVALTVAILPWLVQPGVVQPDTKIDLVLSPGRYLSRALSAWSVHSGFGELQNQAYGYLFPMGPVFWLGHVVGLPGWATQRLWWSLLLFVAATGAMAFARRGLCLGLWPSAVAGVLFAMSPRALTLLSELSVEAWPGALLPWFLVVVHRHAHGSLPGRRFAAWIGVLAVCCGGVNATASFMPILGGGLYLMLTVRREQRLRTTAWFALGVVAGSAWWLGPLVVLGAYAYPFLDYIETSHITTAVTSVPGVLRGASDWVAYIIDAAGHPVWQSGWVVAQSALSIVAGLALAGFGLAGLAPWSGRRGAIATPAARTRAALVALLATGVLIMGIPYAGAVSGPLAHEARALLDGPLTALRNVHKADPLVRLPLVLGVAALLERVGGRRLVAGAAVVAAGLGTWAPLWQGRLGDASGVRAYPAAAREVARAVDAEAASRGGSTFVIPSARSASFTWGTSTDEPLTAMAASPVAWRASAPLVHPGAQRLMDAVNADLTTGRDLPAAATALSRAGVRRLVVRHGLTEAEQAPAADQVVAYLSADPSHFTRHRVFGSGQARYDLFDVVGPGPLTHGPAVTVLGGPESTLSLAAAGMRPGIAYRMGAGADWITDDVRKRVYNNGRPVAVAFGPTLTSGDASDAQVGSRDLEYPGRETSLATLSLRGLDSLTASASAADPFSRTYLGPGAGPAAALDVDAHTAWLAPADTGGTLRLGWRSGTAARATLALTPAVVGGARITGWNVVLDGRAQRLPAGSSPRFVVPRGTRQVSITPTILAPPRAQGHAGAAGIADLHSSAGELSAAVELPGVVDPRRTGVVLTPDAPSAMGIALRGEDGATWSRVLRVAAAPRGQTTMTLRLIPARGTSCANIDVRLDGQPTHGTSGCSRQILLPSGRATLTVSGARADHLVLEPTGREARTHLGLDAALPTGPVLSATGTGVNAGWKGPDGARSVVVDGWQQGFTGEVTSRQVHFAPQRVHTAVLAIGGALAVLCLVGVCVPSRRRAAAAPSVLPTAQTRVGAARQIPQGAIPALVALIVAVLLGGWWGLFAWALAFAVPQRRRALLAALCVATAGPVMAMLGVVARASAGAYLGQLLGLTGLTLFLLAFVDGPMRWPAARRSATSTMRARRRRRPSE